MITEAFPVAPAIVVICDNDSIHHAHAVTTYLQKHPRRDRFTGSLQPARQPSRTYLGGAKELRGQHRRDLARSLRLIHSFFRNRSPGQMLATAAPWTSPWLPPRYAQNFWNTALAELLDEPMPTYVTQVRAIAETGNFARARVMIKAQHGAAQRAGALVALVQVAVAAQDFPKALTPAREAEAEAAVGAAPRLPRRRNEDDC